METRFPMGRLALMLAIAIAISSGNSNGGAQAMKYRFDVCTRIVLTPLSSQQDGQTRVVQFHECADCCREMGYNYFKWERAHQQVPGLRVCSCTQDERQLIQAKVQPLFRRMAQRGQQQQQQQQQQQLQAQPQAQPARPVAF